MEPDWKFITVFTGVLNWALSWARSIQLVSPYPMSLKSILILSTRLCVGLPRILFPSGFSTKLLHAFLFSPFVLYALPISS
jgi:hypothetical protein